MIQGPWTIDLLALLVRGTWLPVSSCSCSSDLWERKGTIEKEHSLLNPFVLNMKFITSSHIPLDKISHVTMLDSHRSAVLWKGMHKVWCSTLGTSYTGTQLFLCILNTLSNSQFKYIKYLKIFNIGVYQPSTQHPAIISLPQKKPSLIIISPLPLISQFSPIHKLKYYFKIICH